MKRETMDAIGRLNLGVMEAEGVVSIVKESLRQAWHMSQRLEGGTELSKEMLDFLEDLEKLHKKAISLTSVTKSIK